MKRLIVITIILAIITALSMFKVLEMWHDWVLENKSIPTYQHERIKP